MSDEVLNYIKEAREALDQAVNADVEAARRLHVETAQINLELALRELDFLASPYSHKTLRPGLNKPLEDAANV